MGLVYLGQKQYGQAIAEAERAIALDPNDAEGYATLGQILNFVGRPEESIGVVERAMRLNPRYPAPYLFTLGQAYCWAGQYKEAIAAQKRAIIRNPNHLGAHGCLAGCLSALGREEEARAEVAEVLRLNPNFSLEVLRQTVPPKDPAVVEHMLDALRKAGLK